MHKTVFQLKIWVNGRKSIEWMIWTAVSWKMRSDADISFDFMLAWNDLWCLLFSHGSAFLAKNHSIFIFNRTNSPIFTMHQMNLLLTSMESTNFYGVLLFIWPIFFLFAFSYIFRSKNKYCIYFFTFYFILFV